MLYFYRGVYNGFLMLVYINSAHYGGAKFSALIWGVQTNVLKIITKIMSSCIEHK